MSIKCPHCLALINIKVSTAPKSHYKPTERFVETPANISAFISHVKSSYIGQKLSITELVKIYSEFIVGSDVSPIRLGILLGKSNEFPHSKVYCIKGKTVRLYHIR